MCIVRSASAHTNADVQRRAAGDIDGAVRVISGSRMRRQNEKTQQVNMPDAQTQCRPGKGFALRFSRKVTEEVYTANGASGDAAGGLASDGGVILGSMVIQEEP